MRRRDRSLRVMRYVCLRMSVAALEDIEGIIQVHAGPPFRRVLKPVHENGLRILLDGIGRRISAAGKSLSVTCEANSEIAGADRTITQAFTEYERKLLLELAELIEAEFGGREEEIGLYAQTDWHRILSIAEKIKAAEVILAVV